MAAEGFRSYRRPPGLYRLARALRWASLLALVLVLVFTATAIYSAAELTRSSASLGKVTESFGSNDTFLLSTTLSVSNPGVYPVTDVGLHIRISNASGVRLGAFDLGPQSIPSAGAAAYPVTLYLPVSSTGPGFSLLVASQNLGVAVWGNATVSYLFPVGVALNENRSWGAPFNQLQVAPGAPSTSNGSVVVPVMVSFQNQASFSDVGSFSFIVLSATGITCGSGTLPVSADPGASVSATVDLVLASGCSPAGGTVTSSYTTSGSTFALPTEPVP